MELRTSEVRMLLLTLATAGSATLFGCDDTFIAIDSSGRIELRFGDVRASANVLTVNNEGADTVFHFVVESQTAQVIDWIPCYDPEPTICPQVEPGDTAEIPYSGITGYEPGDTLAFFNWWTREERVVHSERLRLR